MNKNQKRVAIIAIVLTIILVFAGRAFACDTSNWTCNHWSDFDDTCVICTQRDYVLKDNYYELVKFGREECHLMITPTNEGFRMKSTDRRMDFDVFFDMVHNEACGQMEGELIKSQEWIWWEDCIF